jgi:hypothetical protein
MSGGQNGGLAAHIRLASWWALVGKPSLNSMALAPPCEPVRRSPYHRTIYSRHETHHFNWAKIGAKRLQRFVFTSPRSELTTSSWHSRSGSPGGCGAARSLAPARRRRRTVAVKRRVCGDRANGRKPQAPDVGREQQTSPRSVVYRRTPDEF